MRIWISPAAILVFAVLVQTEHLAALREVVAAEVQAEENSWTRITFPGPRHKEDPAFPSRQGSDRSEYMWFFEVSLQNPSFMILSHNMGGAFVTRNGRGFEPLDLSLHRSTNDVAFCPHDGHAAYLVQGQIGEVSRADPYSGIWRTRDTGRTWTQIYRMPQGTHACRGPWGKQVLVVDPHPERHAHLYFATIDDGLIRSLDGGLTWQGVAFQGLPVKTLAASRGPGGRTVLYVIVGVKGRYGKRDNVLGGSFWRVDVEPAAPFQASTIRLSGADDFWDVEVATNDWSQGMVLRDWYEGGTAGARKLVAFKDGGQVLGKPRTAAEAGVKHFCDVHINPQDAAHVVVRSQGNLSAALQYSRDGGMTWNAPHEVVDGYVPDLVSYNPAHHNAPGGAMPDAIQQGQGVAVGVDSDDRRVVYWWTQNFDKTPLKSMDWGATWKPFAYGGPFKQAAQISVGPRGEYIGVARIEYGFVTTRDGGSSWTGSTPVSDPLMDAEVVKADRLGKSGWARKAGWGLACKTDDPRVMVGLFGAFPSIFGSHDGGLRWEDTGVDTGGRGCVYWHPQDASAVYVADHRSVDVGKTWRKMNRFVLAVSASNGDVLIGNRRAGSLSLSVSTDRGETWADLPDVPKESDKPATSFLLTIDTPLAHGVAIDPDPACDPVTGSQYLRVLLAGRSGIYEYTAAFGDVAAGTWRVINKGFEPSNHFAGAYWMGHVVFDPRPGMHHVVYASKSEDPVLTGAWRNDASCISRHSQAWKPLYRSLDGGRSWSPLHGPEYLGIPDHLDVMVVAVSPSDGSLYIDGYCGLYVLPGVRAGE